MQIQLEEGERSGVYRGCAAEHSPAHRQTKGYLEQEDIAKGRCRGLKGNRCSGEVEEYGANVKACRELGNRIR
jgi:hypothetical protein